MSTLATLCSARWLRLSGKRRSPSNCFFALFVVSSMLSWHGTARYCSIVLAHSLWLFPLFCSHFSYERSDRREMVVDIQGTGYTYTDPQLHSHGKEFGRADRGSSGFKDFFKSHKCNSMCTKLGLPNRSPASVN